MTDKRFLINFGWLNASSLLNKLISFFYVIALIRLLPQSSFGIYNLVWAHLGIMGSWQDLGTTPYGLLQNENYHKKILNNILSIRIVLAFFISLITIFLALLFRYDAQIVKTVVLFSGLYLYTATTGFFLIIASIKKKLQYPAIFATMFNTVLVISNITVLFATKNVYAVFNITALYYFLYGLLIFVIVKKYFFNFRFSIEKAVVIQILRNSFVFSLISFFAGVQTRADSLIINKLLGTKSLALYAAAHKFYDVPLLMVANYNFSSIPVFRSLFIKNKHQYRRKIINDSLLLLGISIVVVLGTWLIGGLVIQTFFSTKYNASIPILNIIMLNLPLVLLASVFLNALYAQNKQHQVVKFFAVVTVINLALNFTLIPWLKITGAAISTVLTYICLTASFGVYLYFTLKNEKNQP